jgi:3-hydroxy-9,10-secoandrosta-1,3,5(10)-triene-9,17-dione monooxygenase
MNLANMTDTIPDGAELIGRARALVPVLAERAAQTERDRIVPKESIVEMQAAGLFRVLQPKRWGGHELGLDVANEIQIILAEGCMSTAWVFAVIAVEPFLIALCDDRMARDVWSADRSTLVCGTSAADPKNQLVAVEGGFRLSGKWRFASGCDHCAWTFLAASVTEADGSSTEWRLLLPKADYTIIDTWNVSGLRGTGSRDIAVEDKFVPAHRTMKRAEVFEGIGPGLALNTAPLYRLPFGQVFAMSVSTLAIGGLQGMLDAFIAYGARRVARGIGPTARDPVALLLCAETAAQIDESKAIFRLNVARLMAHAERGEFPSLAERMQYKFQMAYAVERASLLAARLFKAAGGSGIYVENTPFARMLNDINVTRVHVNNQFEASGRNWGAVLLGASESENRDRML